MNVANLITIIRIFLVPFFIYTLLSGMPHRYSLAILLICVFTDALDGFVARNFKQKTDLGRFLDPLADKFLILSSYCVLAYKAVTPKWFFFLILGKDILVVAGWLLIYLLIGAKKINVRFLGKSAVFLQMSTLVAVLFRLGFVDWLYYFTGAVTFAAAIEYILIGAKSFSLQKTK